FVGLPRLVDGPRAHMDANATAVDLACTKVNEGERLRWKVALLGGGLERLDGFHGLGNDDGRVLHPLMHAALLPVSTPLWSRSRAERRGSFIIAMTDRDERM